MNIWIDLANSPHVLFFTPIIREFEMRGHSVFVTHREFAQTSDLCKVYHISSVAVGLHGGQGVYRKISNILGRAFSLRSYAKNKKIDVAVSHNSYAHCLAAKSLLIPYVTAMDYEYQPANHINFRLADSILVPFTFHLRDIRRYGASSRRLIKYPGLKEEVYLANFDKDPTFFQNEFQTLDHQKVMCVIRPPATMWRSKRIPQLDVAVKFRATPLLAKG